MIRLPWITLHHDIEVLACRSSAPPPKALADESQIFRDCVARIVKEGPSESHLRLLIEECDAFLTTQNLTQVSTI